MKERKNRTKHLSANIKCLFKTELWGNFWRILKCSWVLLYDCYVQFFVRWHSYTVQCLWETELDFGVTISFIDILIFCSIQTGLTRIPSDWANFLLSPSSFLLKSCSKQMTHDLSTYMHWIWREPLLHTFPLLITVNMHFDSFSSHAPFSTAHPCRSTSFSMYLAHVWMYWNKKSYECIHSIFLPFILSGFSFSRVKFVVCVCASLDVANLASCLFAFVYQKQVYSVYLWRLLWRIFHIVSRIMTKIDTSPLSEYVNFWLGIFWGEWTSFQWMTSYQTTANRSSVLPMETCPSP